MTDAKPFLPYGRQWIEDDDIAAVVGVLKGDFLTSGPAVDAFETAFARHVGARHAVACSNGTTALHLTIKALGLGPGDTVIVPTVTFLATANAAVYEGVRVVFADVDPETALMTPDTLRDALARAGGAAKAILPVHLAGQPADMAGIGAVAAECGLKVIEDACHATGGSYEDGHRVGASPHGAMAVFSLHPVKTITTGEGGVITTNDDHFAERMRLLRGHGMVRDEAAFLNADLAFDGAGAGNPWYYEMAEVGFNYRITDMQCALGLTQLAKLDRFVERRAQLVALYDRLLADAGLEHVRPLGRRAGCRPGWHLYVVLIDFQALGTERARVMTAMRERGVGTQVHYLPVHLQPYYRRLDPNLHLPGAWDYYRRCLSLPLFPAMSDDDVARVVDVLAGAIGGRH
ncbi:MAG: UDP-4-amino-4,6-dideoxy-N-acetyl-beta-L-altrosamine transaminase [Alphaproteobacteria bacterium]|nr:UDP-4-amino-4,6-dideoxy-N-acetyl-beta-L-altrosamine transaminase [Alphaproteobacteria bacterium]